MNSTDAATKATALNGRLEQIETELGALMRDEGFAPEGVAFRRPHSTTIVVDLW